MNKYLLVLWEILVFGTLFAALPYSGYSYFKIIGLKVENAVLQANLATATDKADQLAAKVKDLQSKIANMQPQPAPQDDPLPVRGVLDSSHPGSDKVWIPPWSIPVQDHWLWTTSDGKVYQDVKIIKIEADDVTILYSGGGARVPISTLPPDIQTQLHYDPDLAWQAAKQRALVIKDSNEEIADERILAYQQSLVARDKEDFAKFSRMLVGQVGDKLADGYMVTVNTGQDVPLSEYPSGTYHLITNLSYTGTIGIPVYAMDAGTTCCDDLDYAFTHRQKPEP